MTWMSGGRGVAVVVAVAALAGCGGGGSGSSSASARGGDVPATAASAPATGDADPVARLDELSASIVKASGAQGAVFASASAAGDKLSAAVASSGKITVWEASAGAAPVMKATYPADAPALSVRPLQSWPWKQLVTTARSMKCDKTVQLATYTTRGEALQSVMGCSRGAGPKPAGSGISVFLDDHPLTAIQDPYSAESVKELLWEAKVTSPKGKVREVVLGDMRGMLALTVTPEPGPDARGQVCTGRWRRARDFSADTVVATPSGCSAAGTPKSSRPEGPAFDVGAVSAQDVSVALAEAERRLKAPLSQAMEVRLVQMDGKVVLSAFGGMPYHLETIPLGRAGA